MNLAHICLPDILRRLYVERCTGELVVSQYDSHKRIFFEFGNIVFASSSLKEDRIGKFLLRQNLLTYEDFNRALSKSKTGKHFGSILIELGLINEEDLITNVTFQILDIIYSLFTWTEGTYKFIEGENKISQELKLKLTTANIILEGVRRIEDFRIIRKGLGDLNELIVPSSSPLLRMQKVLLKSTERDVLSMITEPTDLLDILTSSKFPPEPTLRAIYGLLSAGVLDKALLLNTSDENIEELVNASDSVKVQVIPPSVATSETSAVLDLQFLRNKIEHIKSLMVKGNLFQIFNITEDASLEDLDKAYFEVARIFHPDHFLQAPREMLNEVNTIFTYVVQSYEQLRQQKTLEDLKNPSKEEKNVVVAAPSEARIPRPAVLRNRSLVSENQRSEEWPNLMMKRPFQALQDEKPINLDTAVFDLIEYLEDRKAPLFVADSLSLLLRTSKPFFIKRERIAEIIAGWAIQRASLLEKPIHEQLLIAVGNIKHAEQSRVLSDFDPNLFYEGFISELLTYCPLEEHQIFNVKLGGVKNLIRKR